MAHSSSFCAHLAVFLFAFACLSSSPSADAYTHASRVQQARRRSAAAGLVDAMLDYAAADMSQSQDRTGYDAAGEESEAENGMYESYGHIQDTDENEDAAIDRWMEEPGVYRDGRLVSSNQRLPIKHRKRQDSTDGENEKVNNPLRKFQAKLDSLRTTVVKHLDKAPAVINSVSETLKKYAQLTRKQMGEWENIGKVGTQGKGSAETKDRPATPLSNAVAKQAFKKLRPGQRKRKTQASSG
eukprot:scpid79724/ scgid34823/ 